MKNPRTRATQLVNVLMPSVPSEMYLLLRQFPLRQFPFLVFPLACRILNLSLREKWRPSQMVLLQTLLVH